MNGLLRRLTRRRAATAEESPPATPAASEPVDATVVSHEEGPVLSEEERAREEELRRRRRDLPAGLDADRLETPAGDGARRGAVRRRIRFLTAAREVLLRDLGGFSYEVHRAAGLAARRPPRHHRDQGRAARRDRRGAAGARGAPRRDRPRPSTVVRQPGIGGTCPACGELHGSDAGWCSHCGTPLSDRARKRAEEATDRAIAERQQRERERGRRRPGRRRAAGAPAEEPSAEHKRALEAVHRPHRRAGGRHRRAARRREGRARRVPADAPTTDLGEPVASERRP